jgi:hypothetical protein
MDIRGTWWQVLTAAPAATVASRAGLVASDTEGSTGAVLGREVLRHRSMWPSRLACNLASYLAGFESCSQLHDCFFLQILGAAQLSAINAASGLLTRLLVSSSFSNSPLGRLVRRLVHLLLVNTQPRRHGAPTRYPTDGHLCVVSRLREAHSRHWNKSWCGRCRFL